jgi:hypothetical protein
VNGFQAIVIVERPQMKRTRLPRQHSLAYAFTSFVPALTFLQSTHAKAVLVEFDVEVPTMDFCDALKSLNVSIIFSATSLYPDALETYGLSASDVVFPAPAMNRRAS